MLRALKDSFARAGHRAALGIWASLFVMVGLGFITVALWIYLSAVLGPSQAAALIGLGYGGVGLILFGILATPPRDTSLSESAARSEPQTGAAPLVDAFLIGLQAGSRASKSN